MPDHQMGSMAYEKSKENSFVNRQVLERFINIKCTIMKLNKRKTIMWRQSRKISMHIYRLQRRST